jgi:hypothetical protein
VKQIKSLEFFSSGLFFFVYYFDWYNFIALSLNFFLITDKYKIIIPRITYQKKNLLIIKQKKLFS